MRTNKRIAQLEAQLATMTQRENDMRQIIREQHAELAAALEGALLYITALVLKATDGADVRTMAFTHDEMARAMDFQLERADMPDGSLVLRIAEPEAPKSIVTLDKAKTLAKAAMQIVIPGDRFKGRQS